jgi:hypothetical protein
MTSDDGRAARLGLSALSQLVESALDGIAVIDPGSKAYIYVNPAGCRLLGRDSRELSGHCASPFNTVREATSTESNRALENLLYGALEFECTTSLIEADDGDLLVVRFRDVTEARLQQRRLNTFSRTSASIAFAGSLRTVLDRLADDVRQATGMVACTFLLMNETGDLRQAGTSGDYPNVDDYNERLKACRDLGAPLLAIEAFESHAPLISVGWREKTLADSRFAPLHDISRDANWHSIAVVPLVVRDRILGVFNGFTSTATNRVLPISPFSVRSPTRPLSPSKTPGSWPRSRARSPYRSVTIWPASCTTRSVRRCSR